MADLNVNLQGVDYAQVLVGGLLVALREGRCVEFDYDGKRRVVEAHAVGLTSKGKLVMRGYQVGGESSRPLPCWALFRLDEVEDGSFSLQRDFASAAPRHGYAMGDKQMGHILCEIDLNGNAGI